MRPSGTRTCVRLSLSKMIELCPRPKARPLVVLVTGEQGALVSRRVVTKAALARFAKAVYYWGAPVVWDWLKGTSPVTVTVIICHGGRVSQRTFVLAFEPTSGFIVKKSSTQMGASLSELFGRSTGLVYVSKNISEISNVSKEYFEK